MELLEKRILAEGKVRPGNILKVDSFLNHQLDPELFHAMAEELRRLFAGERVDKILTVEASGIALAVIMLVLHITRYKKQPPVAQEA